MSNFGIDISSLNRWQRMRVVALAIGCGADFNKLYSDNKNHQLEQENTNSSPCPICNSPSSNKNATKIPFASPARSLVDKHFDALAQTMSEIGIEWTVETGNDDNHQKDLLLTFLVANEDETEEKKEATCFLCSLAKICNNNNNNNNKLLNENDQTHHSDDAEASNHWWWNEKYSPNYINMETGDIGPFDPKEDFLVKPLQSWGENCRFVLSTISQRLANIVVSKEKAAQERSRNNDNYDDEEEENDETDATPQDDEETLSRRMQDAISQSEILKQLAEKFASDKVVVNVSVNLQNQDVVVSFDSRSEQNESVFTSGGFNRTKVTLVDSESGIVFADQIMKSPFSYSLFLFQIISKITSAFADEVLKGDKSNIENKKLFIASLTAATFSDARRRQSAVAAPAASHNNNPMMATMMMNSSPALPQQPQQLPSGLPSMMMAMLNSVTNNNVTATNANQHQLPTPSTSSSQADNLLAMVMAGRKGATSTSSAADIQKNEASINEAQQHHPSSSSSQETTVAIDNSSVEAILARIEQQKQLMLMSQPVQKNESIPPPPPPFLIPLSYFEEMLVLGEHTLHEHYDSFHQLRYRVELEDHEEEELTNYLFEKPTYVGEFGNFLRSITAKK